jgi:predicted RNase H-like nuclease (RuvC/YqgF family)
MRKDPSARRTPFWQQLFAERQIYLRSGEDSRYVVLSRRLQIGVTVGAVLLIGSLALASYGYLSQRFGVVEQNRQLDDAIAAGAGQLRRELKTAVDAEAEQLGQQLELATRQIEALGAERDALATKIAELTSSAEPRDQDATRLNRQLTDAEAEIRRLNEALSDTSSTAEAQLASLKDEIDALRAGGAGPDSGRGTVDRQLAEIKGSASTSPDEVLELKQDLAGAQATIAGLTADLAAARAASGEARRTAPQAAAAAPEARVAGPDGPLLVAQARIAELEARLAVLATGLAPAPAPAAPR